MSNLEFTPRDFEWSSDISELTEYLWSNTQDIQEGTHQTPEEIVIQTANNMAVTWMRLNSCNEPIGWRFQTDQLKRESQYFLSSLETINKEPIQIISLAADIASAITETETPSEEMRIVRDASFVMKMQLLVDRLKSVGFKIPEIDDPYVFSETWKTWKRYGLDSI